MAIRRKEEKRRIRMRWRGGEKRMEYEEKDEGGVRLSLSR